MKNSEKYGDEELVGLISSACDGLLSEAERRRLDELLQADERARRIWLSFSRLHTELCVRSQSERALRQTVDVVQGSMSCQQAGSEAGDEESAPEFTVRSARLEEDHPPRGRRRHWVLGGALALAASLLLAIVGTDRNAETDAAPQAQEVAQREVDEEGYAARIVRKVDCDWEGDRWAASTSSQVRPGQTLNLSSGLMELRFASGAQVTLEAPATFTVETGMHGVLSAGKLSARVPDCAKGFTVATPQGDVVDLGTEFGLWVNRDGEAETHVFDGEVLVRPYAEMEGGKEISLTDDMALRIAEDPSESAEIEVAPARFARLEFDRGREVEAPDLDRDLILWFSASGRVQLDEERRVVAWGDLLTETNLAAEDAWQVEPEERPRFAEDAINGHPGIRFSGAQSLVTAPVSLGYSTTAVAVFRVNSRLFDEVGPKDTSGLQILNTNVSPKLVFGVSHRMGVFSRLRTGARKGPTGEWYALDASSLESDYELVRDKSVVVVSIYDPQNNSSRLYLNGKLLVEAEAPVLEPTFSTRHIGAHSLPEEGKYFYGDIAELMIYGTGLSDGEARGVSRSLMKKYALLD